MEEKAEFGKKQMAGPDYKLKEDGGMKLILEYQGAIPLFMGVVKNMKQKQLMNF